MKGWGADGPVATHRMLGWLLSGGIDSSHSGGNTCIHLTLTIKLKCIPEIQDPTHEVLQIFWETESMEIVETNPEFTKNSLNYIQFQEVNMKLHYHGRKATLKSLFILP